jgi:hypothetical protein
MVKIQSPADFIVNSDNLAAPDLGGVAVWDGTFDKGDTTAKTLFTLPAGAVPLDWWIDVTVDFNAGTNNDIDFGISTDDDYFAADLAIGTLAVYRLGDTNYVAGRMGVQLTVPTAVQVIYKPTGTAVTTGDARVFLSWRLDG